MRHKFAKFLIDLIKILSSKLQEPLNEKKDGIDQNGLSEAKSIENQRISLALDRYYEDFTRIVHFFLSFYFILFLSLFLISFFFSIAF